MIINFTGTTNNGLAVNISMQWLRELAGFGGQEFTSNVFAYKLIGRIACGSMSSFFIAPCSIVGTNGISEVKYNNGYRFDVTFSGADVATIYIIQNVNGNDTLRFMQVFKISAT